MAKKSGKSEIAVNNSVDSFHSDEKPDMKMFQATSPMREALMCI